MATEFSNGKKTVKLYSSVNRGKALFQLSYYEGGKRVQRNFSDKAEAKRVARAIVGSLGEDAEAVDNLSTPELESYLAARKALASNYALHVAVTEHAQAINRLGKATLQEAVDFFLKHHRKEVGRMPLAALCDQFVASRIQSRFSKEHVGNCQKQTRRLVQAFPGESISDLTTEMLDNWLGKVTQLGPVTKNHLIKGLSNFGSWAEKRGHLARGSNPFREMMRYKVPSTPISIFKPEELEVLLTSVHSNLIPFITLGAFAGLRSCELQRLDWSEIDLERGYITVAASKAKTRRRRLVPISENLKSWLTPHKQESGPICSNYRPQLAAQRDCKGFKWARNVLRHSYISYRLAILHDTARVSLEAGNSPQVIFGHYRELVTPEAAQCWFKISPAQS